MPSAPTSAAHELFFSPSQPSRPSCPAFHYPISHSKGKLWHYSAHTRGTLTETSKAGALGTSPTSCRCPGTAFVGRKAQPDGGKAREQTVL